VLALDGREGVLALLLVDDLAKAVRVVFDVAFGHPILVGSDLLAAAETMHRRTPGERRAGSDAIEETTASVTPANPFTWPPPPRHASSTSRGAESPIPAGRPTAR